MVPLPYLPENILEDIFRKLPYKAMARLKLVCKSWNSIISCPKFMHDYSNYRRLAEGNHLIIFDVDVYRYSRTFGLYTSNHGCLVHDQSSSSITTLRQFDDLHDLKLLGSYNGLVAISFEYRLILWNPLTNTHSSIRGPYRTIPHFDESRLLYGLCYDSICDEYCMVFLVNYQSPFTSPSRFDKEISYEGTHSIIYSFKDGGRRDGQGWHGKRHDIRLLDKKVFKGDIGKVICGIPHWVVQFYDYKDPWVKTEILYFDSRKEEFTQMAQPSDDDGEKMILGLAAMDGEQQLGCVLHDIASSSLEVWSMKEYGKPESWTKMFNLPYMNVSKNHGSIKYMDVMGYMPNEELLIYLNDHDLLVYNVKEGKSRQVRLLCTNYMFVMTYLPTLSSPFKYVKDQKWRLRTRT